MGILDLFSKRQQRLRGEVPDVYTYDKLPNELRVQIVHILKDYMGTPEEAAGANYNGLMVGPAYQHVVESLCREYGLFHLPGTKTYGDRDYVAELFTFILQEKDVEKVLDAVELSCKVIDVHTRSYGYRRRNNGDKQADDALSELNARFQQRGFGYRYESGEIVRVDSELVHAEVIKPALSLIHDTKYKGAEAEFHLAFEHYRHGRNKEALAECLKALESTLKAISKAHGWKHAPNATAKPLIDLMFDKGLIPQLWAQHFTGVRAMLESGVPTARNRLGGHGQGPDVVEVPGHYVGFALHQTAAAIVFLVKSEQEL